MPRARLPGGGILCTASSPSSFSSSSTSIPDAAAAPLGSPKSSACSWRGRCRAGGGPVKAGVGRGAWGELHGPVVAPALCLPLAGGSAGCSRVGRLGSLSGRCRAQAA